MKKHIISDYYRDGNLQNTVEGAFVLRPDDSKSYFYGKSVWYDKYGNITKSTILPYFNVNDPNSFIDFLENKNLKKIEGVWEMNVPSNPSLNGKMSIQYNEEELSYSFNAPSIAGFNGNIEETASGSIYTISAGEFRQPLFYKDDFLLEFNINNSLKAILIKTYPKSNPIEDNENSKTGEWSGNGSGIIISESGYIVTNNHVIEDANQIEVEFMLNDEIQNFNAEIVQVDRVNDLAIIKIFDMNFDGVNELPYNFKSKSSDVGTTVYAYGYPMALSAMGKEIKVTDGIINSKSGFQGDITTYQISAPIQGGNSGGPLFDDKGNFIGINSAVIRKDIADNVGYTIKSSYVLNLIDVLPKSIDLPSSNRL